MKFSSLWMLFPCIFACTTEKPQDTESNDTSETIIEDSGNTEPVDTAQTDPEPTECEGDSTGRRLLRRLTRDEFEATVRSVFHLNQDEWSADSLPPDSAAENGFSNNADRLSVSASFASSIGIAAKQAGLAISAEPKLSTLLPCAANQDDACVETFLDTYGRVLFRRALTETEKERYRSIRADFPEIDFATWIRVATTGLLQSPHVLYRSELGEEGSDDGIYELSPQEVATAISYTYTGAPPTAEILDLANDGGLQTAEQRVDLARALVLGQDGVVSSEFTQIFLDFASRWLGYVSVEGLTKDPIGYDGFDQTIAQSMRVEADTFIENVILQDRGSITELLTHDSTWVDANLVSWYGLNDSPGEVIRFEGWGKGVLSLGAIMSVQATANWTSPTQRGLNVRRKLYCQDPPPPPVDIPELPPQEEATTTRERYETLHAPGSCQSCHQLFDPIGFAFEHIDAAGRYREDENGYTIDSSGSLVAFWPDGEDHPEVAFDGPDELAEVLAEEEKIAPCFSSFAASYSFGLGNEEVECFVHQATEEFSSGSIDIVELFIQFAGSEHFLYRSQEASASDPSQDPDPDPTPDPDPDPDPDPSPTSEPSTESESTCGTECYALPDAPASDEWCQINCLHDPPFCPPELCECEDIPCE